MILHYIKTILRNLNKQKLNSGINILGLSLGLSISLLIWIFVLHEISYDRFFDDHQQIYRINNKVTVGQGDPQTLPASVFPLGRAAYDLFPGVENYVRFSKYYSSVEVVVNDNNTTLTGTIFADSTFFTVFNFELLAGDRSNLLSQANSVVLTQGTAEKLFGDPLKALNSLVNIQKQTYNVTGVIKDLPRNTHMQFTAVFPQENLPDHMKNSGTNFYTYLKLTPGADLESLEEKMDLYLADHIKNNPVYEGIPLEIATSLVNITDIHLHSNLVWEMKANGSYRNVVGFTILAVFILFIAVINYVNLSTARSSLRSKEIGMRKVVGASRSGLIRQLMLESMMITSIAFFLALAITEVSSGVFSQALGVTFSTTTLMTAKGLVVILSMLLITGFLAGLYPALYMAGFDPIKTLKGNAVRGSKGRFFRRSLVVFQFAITIFIISSLIVITRQLNYMQTSNLGFDKEQVILVRDISANIWRSFPQVRAELEQLSRVEAAAGANFIYGGSNRVDLIAEQGVSKESGVTADILTIDENFLKVMGITISQGRNFHSDSQTDLQGAFILNQAAVDVLQMKDPVDKQMDLFGRQGPLVGVVENFYLKSLHQKIEPVVMIFAQRGFTNVYIRVTPGNYMQLQEEISAVFKEFDAEHVPNIVFLDERINNLYQQEQNQATLMSAGSLLAIIISILGVYGLASFSAERRTKEIGIRKVLGASTAHLLWVFNKESAVLVSVAFLLAAPISMFMMNNWLDNFAVRTPLNALWFLLPGFFTLVLSSATISMQAWITSRANPVKSLRSE